MRISYRKVKFYSPIIIKNTSWMDTQLSYKLSKYTFNASFIESKKNIDERRQHFRKVMAFENNGVICIEAVTMLFQHTLGDCGKNSFLIPFQCQRKGEFACCLKSCLYRKVKLFSKLVIILF